MVSTPFDARPEVESFEVKKIRNTFVAGNKFWTLKGKRMEYRELEHLPCIFLEKDTSTRKFMDRFLEQRGIILEEFAKEKIESGELFELAFREMMPEREICVVTDKKVPISPAGERFLEVLRERKV